MCGVCSNWQQHYLKDAMESEYERIYIINDINAAMPKLVAIDETGSPVAYGVAQFCPECGKQLVDNHNLVLDRKYKYSV